MCRDTELSVEPSKSDVENGARVCSQLLRQCNAVAAWWPLLLSIKNGLVGLKINVQKKCWCKHALQSQWGGESLSFILFNLLRFDMQAPGWLCCWREVWLVEQLSGLPRPLIGKAWRGHPCLPTCLEAITTTLEISSAPPPPPLVFSRVRRKVANDYLKR